ncbi:OmpP1/FadL family transporter [Ideonella sp. A 288]|uniref:OmpP1/FadL family transporter n=1 Tax=Ideonella sp. A 288 TaxID=1962181 RepID=UPI001303E449|nr:outer membrane protein transport protein [Ideonella sp. A 288]
MTCSFKRTAIAVAAAGSLLAIGALPAHAAGFQINESSASGLGTAFAGGAAAAEDASILWSNAAGISRLRSRQVVGAIHLVTPSLKFRNEGSLPAASQPLGGNGGDAGGVNVVPDLFVVAPLDRTWTVGLGVTAPYGLVTEYDDGWIGRFQAMKSSIRTLNLNPTVAWNPAGGLAFGLGLDVQRIQAVFTNRINYSGALLSAAASRGIAPGSATFNAIAQATAGLESAADIRGSDNAVGWNAGVLWEIDGDSRAGVHYRSPIRYRIDGRATFANPVPSVPQPLAAVVGALATGVNAAVLNDTAVTSEVKLPAIVNLSYFTALDRHWDVMVDAQWTQWSSIQELAFRRSDGSLLQSTPEHFKDAWKLALGVNRRMGSDLMLRGGVAVDRSPVQANLRTPRLPDADRLWLAGGFQYRASPSLSVDAGAAYLWVRKATISISGHPSSTSAYGLIDGRYDNRTVILSAQATLVY